MGLLDSLTSEQGLLGLSLLAAAAPKERRTSIGEGLLMASQNVMQQRNAQEERAARMRMQQMQEQQLQMQLAAQKRQQAMEDEARAREAQFRSLIPSPQMQANADALSGGGGPTVANAAKVRPVDPAQQLQYEALRLGQIKPLDYINAQRKDTTPMKLVAGEALIDPRTYKPLFTNPKESATPEAIRAIEAVYGAGSPEAIKAKRDYIAKMTTHQPATQVSVNTGQKGLDNTLKLRGDFRSEPVYKAHQEMQSAYAQIQQSLKQASPAGDLAGATKIMKLLDPGSVVRESELGMAMQASGLMDRLANYADNIIKGTKLTPTQRADFQRLADALYAESVKQYNAKRAEYQGIAERNQLSVPDVLGSESTMPTPAAGGWSIKPKGQ